MCLRTWKYCSSNSFMFGSSLLFIFFKAGLNDLRKLTHSWRMPNKLCLSTVLRQRVCLDFEFLLLVRSVCNDLYMSVFWKWRLTVAAESNHSTIARETRWTIVRLQIEIIKINSFHLGRNWKLNHNGLPWICAKRFQASCTEFLTVKCSALN